MVKDKTQLKRRNFEIKSSRCHMNGHNKATWKLSMPFTQETTQPNTSVAAKSNAEQYESATPSHKTQPVLS